MDPKQLPEKTRESDSPKNSEEPTPVLSEDEQMAQFEESLKETDWGHQPC